MNKRRLEAIAEKIRIILRNDILERYDNPEYWDYELLEIKELVSNLTEEEETRVWELVESL